MKRALLLPTLALLAGALAGNAAARPAVKASAGHHPAGHPLLLISIDGLRPSDIADAAARG
ncbi:hypothetical protein ACE4ZU_26995, partial [Salmonella enterica]|uniref:hypothetical protein n=1 Tax=Salmonella enterica TaxID=28901 RepID=UPI003D2A62DB